MANRRQVELIKKGGKAFRKWQKANRGVRLDLSGAALQNADLSKSDLGFSNLREVDLRFANLQQSYIGHTNLQSAQLQGADLRNADLSGADLTEANLSNADLRGTQLVGAVDLKYHKVGGAPTPAKFSCANLTGTSFTRMEESTADASFLELASVEGLESADFGDPEFLPNYIQSAFDYTHGSDLKEAALLPEFFAHVSDQIRLLQTLFAQAEQLPAEVIELIRAVSAELITYLAGHPHAFLELSPRQFEELVAEMLASLGWQVHVTPATKDGGYDIFAISRSTTGVETSWLIECKRYKPENRVGVEIIRALYGTRELSGMHDAQLMLATTSHFTSGVHAIKASRYDLELRDCESLIDWVNTYRPNPNGRLYIKNNRLILPRDDEYTVAKASLSSQNRV